MSQLLNLKALIQCGHGFFFNLNLTIYLLSTILILDAVIYKFDSSKISTRGGSLVSGIDKKRHQLMVIFGRKHSNFGSWYVALSLVSTIALLFLIRTMAFMRYAPRAPTYNGFQDIWDVPALLLSTPNGSEIM